MRLRAGAAIAVLLLAGACGGSDEPTDEPSAAESPAASEPAAAELVAAPGAIGPVQVGMTVDEANATGLFEPREVADDDPCKEAYASIQWKAPNTENLMVAVEDDTIAMLGIKDGVKTAKDVGVGSTWGDVQAAYPDAEAEESQALGSTVYRTDGDKFLGMGFNETPDEIKDSSKVVFMEVATGEKPAVYLSGCSY
jgi:hypothetical protein